MSEDIGTFRIKGGKYPWVRIPDFLFVDWALIRDITGLDAAGFALAHHDESAAPPDPLVELGYAAVSFWHRHPEVTRERVALEAHSWKTGDILFEAPAPDPAETEEAESPVPPAEAGPGSGSSSSEESSPTSSESATTPVPA